MRFRLRRRDTPDPGIYVATGGVTLGVLDPDALHEVMEEATVKAMRMTVEEIQAELEITVEPGSFYLGTLVAGVTNAGCPRPMLMEHLRQDERLAEMIRRLRVEV